jgi:hypothetical protein
MRQVDGGEDDALTRGGLSDTLSTLSNLIRKDELNRQKSAEAIVHVMCRHDMEGLNIMENERPGVRRHAMKADNPYGPIRRRMW